ncbi:50S ribosomal protein L33 [Apilactobacillus xinyiensis]|uniref:Large ribosomal subunit protein bL33 n=1 Tax=Apilactobacillus xinyiensis TaxID=2841032 RepID=A0ABT0I2R1_9LACO|nr:50S ribosomal protein L33 [Apilactobacillus xinyiensis]MCK8625017.1 50S ribosomal protein L33 [Apilactobacillus xinyiensis]MCL0319087.1 50S ribosomal protein L33 [Apilactobacillus xinyiensis]
MAQQKIVLACFKCGSRNYNTSAKIDREKRFAIKKFCKKCGESTLHLETK